MVIILPKDCYCPPKLSDADKCLNPERNVQVSVTIAGNIERKFMSPVYSIRDRDTKKVILLSLNLLLQRDQSRWRIGETYRELLSPLYLNSGKYLTEIG